MAESNDVKIARLEEKVDGIREQHKVQYGVLDKKLDDQAIVINSVNKKIDSVVAYDNRKKGVVGTLILIVGSVGGWIGSHIPGFN